MKVKRILAPTDFSPGSLEAVGYAVNLAREFGAKVGLLYVVDTSYALPEAIYASDSADRVLNEGRQAAQHELSRLAAKFSKSGAKLHTLLLEGPAARRIVEAARKLRIDWIVMGTHGRTGAAEAAFGSVAGRVVATAPCPVLTVPVSGRKK